MLRVEAISPEQALERPDVQPPAAADAERAQRELVLRRAVDARSGRLEAGADADGELAPAGEPQSAARVDRHGAHRRQRPVDHDAPVRADLEQASLLRRAPGGAAGVDREAEHAVGTQGSRLGEVEDRGGAGPEEAQRPVVAGDDPAGGGLGERRDLVLAEALAGVVGEEAPASDPAEPAEARDPEAALAIGQEGHRAVADEPVLLAERLGARLARPEHEQRARSAEVKAPAAIHPDHRGHVGGRDVERHLGANAQSLAAHYTEAPRRDDRERRAVGVAHVGECYDGLGQPRVALAPAAIDRPKASRHRPAGVPIATPSA